MHGGIAPAASLHRCGDPERRAAGTPL